MADKRISQLVDRGTVANNDVVPIVVSGAVTTNKATISSIQTFMQGNLDLGVTSVGITFGTSGTDINASGSPVTSSGNITINLPTASATNRGALSSADWITFNAKQPAGNYVTLDTVQTITAQKTFAGSGSSDTMIISHGSGSGFALDVIKAGNGETLRVTKTSGSGNAMTVIGGNFEAPTIVKTGGTSSQFLKADGSVDSSTYLTTGTAASTYLPLVGGTLTGNLNGTTSIFGSAFASNQTSKIGIGFESGYSIFNSWGADSSTYGGFKFQINSSIGDPFAALRIDPSGTTFLGNTEVQGTLQSGTAQIESNNDSPLSTSPPTLSILNGYEFCKLVIGGSNTFPEFYNFFGVIAMENNDNLADTKLRFYLGNKDTATAGHSNDQLVIQGDGNVGIGTPSPVNGLSSSRTLNIYGGASTGGEIVIEGNSGGNFLSLNAGTSSGDLPIVLFNRGLRLGHATSKDATGFVEAVRITSGGNVLMSSANIPDSTADAGNLYVFTTDGPAADKGAKIMMGGIYTGATKYGYASISGRNESGTAGNVSGYMTFATHNNTGGHIERMRITSGGYLKASPNGSYLNGSYNEINSNTNDQEILYNYHSGTSPYGVHVYFNSAPNNGTNYFQRWRDGSASRAWLYSDGGFANYQANDTNLSDERTKKDIAPLESYWDKFKAIEIVKFKYKDQTHNDFNIGVIAQQVEAVAPEFVDVDGWGSKPELDGEGNEIVSEEEPLKSIYTADLHHATIKVLQEAMAKIEKLEIEISSLKTK